MCGTPTAPALPPVAPEAPRAPDASTSGASENADARRRRAAAGESSRSTILTGARGVEDGGATAQKTLLGS